MTHTNQSTEKEKVVHFGHRALSLEDVVAVAKGAKAQLKQSSDYQTYIQKGADFIDSLLSEEGVVYGVTTGYGDSCTVTVGLDLYIWHIL